MLLKSRFPYDAATELEFTATIDAGPTQILFDFVPAANPFAPGSMRPMDDGTNEDPANLLFATGDATITKTFAEGGASTAAGDLFLDKSLAATGALDNFATTIAGTGSILTITLNGHIPFEAAVFDNIVITGVPEPTGLALLSLGAVMLLRRRDD